MGFLLIFVDGPSGDIVGEYSTAGLASTFENVARLAIFMASAYVITGHPREAALLYMLDKKSLI